MITKKFRILTLALIFSGALNIGLVAAFVFFSLKESELSLPMARPKVKGKAESTNGQLLGSMLHLTFRELVSFLTNRDPVEEGYAKRDLAIAVLVNKHHFNLEKALSAAPAQVRSMELSSGSNIDLFPGLTEEQFEAIIRFAYQEKWPLTAKGLFSLLQKRGGSRDESLEQAFLVTPEFHALQMLFQKTDAAQEPVTLLNFICEGTWDLLEKFVQDQALIVDFSPEKRRELILRYLAHHSLTAAQLLLRTDFLFALKRLEDRGILDLLTLLKRQSEEGTKFCVELLRSSRSDAIWQAAAMTLYSYAGEMPTAPIDPKAVLARFTPQAPIAPAPAPQPVAVVENASRFHVVKDGESLWKISRQYKVKVEEIVTLNGLEKDSLFPGMTLKIP